MAELGAHKAEQSASSSAYVLAFVFRLSYNAWFVGLRMQKQRGKSVSPPPEGYAHSVALTHDRWMAAACRLGHYGFLGLPTQSTANQMFGRVAAFLESIGTGDRSTPVLAHSAAEGIEGFRSIVAVYEEDKDRLGVRWRGAVPSEGEHATTHAFPGNESARGGAIGSGVTPPPFSPPHAL